MLFPREMLFPRLDGIPYYINPLQVGPKTIVRHLKGTPQEYFVADAVSTIEAALKGVPCTFLEYEFDLSVDRLRDILPPQGI